MIVNWNVAQPPSAASIEASLGCLHGRTIVKHTIRPIILITAASLVFSPSASAKSGRPKLKLTPTAFDFGYMPQGFKVTNRYWVANTGTDTLLVSEVKPLCGCTTAPLKKNRIAPGDSVSLDVVFDSKNITGGVNKKVTIFTNDLTQNPAEISFTVRVQDRDSIMTVKPRFATFLAIDKRKDSIALTNNTLSEYKVRLAAPPPEFIKCEFSSDRVLPGGSISLTLTRGKGAPVGEYETSITLWLDGPLPYPLSIPIKGVGYIE